MNILVGMSGGVDSSTTLAILKAQGHSVSAITMKLGNSQGHSCISNKDEDIDTCQTICDFFDIPYYIVDLRKEFEETVISYFKDEYNNGRTPNPCVKCNETIKFGFLLNKAREIGIEFDYFATGHYARIEKINDKFYLKKAVDEKKDQSYFLHKLSSEILSKTIFPLGNLTKEEVRKLAKKFSLPTASKRESQDFIPDYTSIFDLKEGEIVDENGKVLGKHSGIQNYTIGQRKKINVGSLCFVKEIDSKSNRIVVSHNEIASNAITIDNLNIFDPFVYDGNVFIKIRNSHIPAHYCNSSRTDKKDKGIFIFDESQKNITPGQSAVFYHNDIVVGYGTIC